VFKKLHLTEIVRVFPKAREAAGGESTAPILFGVAFNSTNQGGGKRWGIFIPSQSLTRAPKHRDSDFQFSNFLALWRYRDAAAQVAANQQVE
jgi:hypothetical protein